MTGCVSSALDPSPFCGRVGLKSTLRLSVIFAPADSRGLSWWSSKISALVRVDDYLPAPLRCTPHPSLQLWGKLETLGLGTALKIMLFSSDDEGKKDLASLSRNELIALVNTAAQLAKSVGSVPEWRWLGTFVESLAKNFICT